jgi:hypothetical protein
VSAEAIARVVADLRAGRQRRPHLRKDPKLQEQVDEVAALPGPVVDATAIYESLVERDDPVAIYEDHPCIAPPWPAASVCYRNEHGNVIVMSLLAAEYEGPKRDDPTAPDGARKVSQPGPWEPAEPVDWDRVRWITDAWLWIGGRSEHTGPFPTMGPLHWWRFATYADGEPADLHWVNIVPEYPMERWDMAHLVLLGALNFCNCRNVEIVEPQRARPEAKRIARTGVRVSTINVFPTGRTTRGATGQAAGVPLTSVRGHFAHYGACCAHHEPRGLLFGKLEGRYWIPQHARGSAEQGEIDSEYVLRP